MPRHPLFQAALDADEAFTAAIAELFPNRDRWSLTRAERLHPRIVAAYTSKVEADRAWIGHLRELRGDPNPHSFSIVVTPQPHKWGTELA